ncbi:MAG: hypothetical protein K6C94_04205 [Candidatus Gastranaerophilales bacterium]|nr:hypothetical protein [Candidatus Gastranaerophilales bacterium]
MKNCIMSFKILLPKGIATPYGLAMTAQQNEIATPTSRLAMTATRAAPSNNGRTIKEFVCSKIC